MNASTKIVIIGAGIIGAMSAYFLAQQGCQVTLIDRDRFAGGASHGNCGGIAPSHIMPLAQPGVVAANWKRLFNPQSPLYVRPNLDWRRWSWLWQFYRHCNQANVDYASQGRAALLNSSRSLYQSLVSQHQFDCDWKECGYLFVFRRPESFAQAQTHASLYEKFQIEAHYLDAKATVDLEPALKQNTVSGCIRFPGDALLRPDKLMACLRLELQSLGVHIVEQCEVVDFNTEAQSIASVQSTQGVFLADKVILAAGAYTPILARKLGLNLPIQPGKGYSLLCPRPSLSPEHLMVFSDDKVAVSPFESGLRLGSIMEFVGYDEHINPRRIAFLKSTAARYLHMPYTEPVTEEWSGFRPMTPSGLPIIDQHPQLANTWIAAGHNMMGMSMGPATGKLISELVLARKTHIDSHWYALKNCS